MFHWFPCSCLAFPAPLAKQTVFSPLYYIFLLSLSEIYWPYVSGILCFKIAFFFSSTSGGVFLFCDAMLKENYTFRASKLACQIIGCLNYQVGKKNCLGFLKHLMEKLKRSFWSIQCYVDVIDSVILELFWESCPYQWLTVVNKRLTGKMAFMKFNKYFQWNTMGGITAVPGYGKKKKSLCLVESFHVFS